MMHVLQYRPATYLFNLRIVSSAFLTPASKPVLLMLLGRAGGAASAILSTASLASGVSVVSVVSGASTGFFSSSDMVEMVGICSMVGWTVREYGQDQVKKREKAVYASPHSCRGCYSSRRYLRGPRSDVFGCLGN